MDDNEMIKSIFSYLIKRLAWLALFALVGFIGNALAFDNQQAYYKVRSDAGFITAEFESANAACAGYSTSATWAYVQAEGEPVPPGFTRCVRPSDGAIHNQAKVYKYFRTLPCDNGSLSGTTCTCNANYYDTGSSCSEDDPNPDGGDGCENNVGLTQNFSHSENTTPSFMCDANSCQWDLGSNGVGVCFPDEGRCYTQYTGTPYMCENIQVGYGTGSDAGNPGAAGSQPSGSNGTGTNGGSAYGSNGTSGGNGGDGGDGGDGGNGGTGGNNGGGTGGNNGGGECPPPYTDCVGSGGDGNGDGVTDSKVQFDNVPYVPAAGRYDFGTDFDANPFGGGASACPADVVTSTSKGSISFSYQPTCDFIISVKPIVILLAFLAGAYIISRRET